MNDEPRTPNTPVIDNGQVRHRGWRRSAAVAATVVLLGVVLLVSLERLWRARPRLTDEEARNVVMSTLQRESRRAFVITGALDMTVTTRVRHTRRLLPGILNANLGFVESTVRAPGRVSYGFALAELKAEGIHVAGDTIVLRVPDARVYSVEPQLSALEIETRSGWLRLADDDRAEVQQRATELVQSTLRAQAERHLQDSEQPRINTAMTLRDLLLPALRASGLRDPVFRFIINEQLIYTGARD